MKIIITERQLKKMSLLIEDVEVDDFEVGDTEESKIGALVNEIRNYLPLDKENGGFDGVTLLQSILVDSGFCVHGKICNYVDGDFGTNTENALNGFIGTKSLVTDDDLNNLEDGMLDPNNIGPEKTTKSYDDTITFWDKVLDEEEYFKTHLEQHVGKPYVWGLDGPDTFDCSGFVNWVFFQGNKNKIANEFYELYGTGDNKVEKQNLKSGDLIFWTGHIGIVIGTTGNDVKFIHSSGGSTNCSKEKYNKAIEDNDLDDYKKRCRVKVQYLNKYGRSGFKGFGRIPEVELMCKKPLK